MLDGLLGNSLDDPRTLGLLQMAAALSSGRKFMPALAQGLLARQQVVQGAADAEEAKKDRAMRRGLLDMQIQEQKRQMEQAGIDRRLTQEAFSPVQPINANAVSGITGPRPEALKVVGQMPAFDPMAFIRQGGTPQTAFSLKQSMTKDTTPIKLGKGETILDPITRKPIYTAPDTPDMPAAVREYQFAQQQGYKGSFQQFEIEKKRAGATNLSVNTGPKAFDNELGKAAVETFMAEREKAGAAVGVLQSVGEIRKAVQGGAFQGTGAELKMNAAKALGALGMPYDANTVANSELFSAQANQFVLNSIKQLGANPSNADREFIEKTVPRLQTDPAALPAMLSFLERKAQGQVRSFNEKAKNVQKGATFLPFGLDVKEPESSGDGGWGIRPIGG